MIKVCSTCKQALPATAEYFASRQDRKMPQLQTMCKKCQRVYRKTHYEKNKKKYIDKARVYTRSIVDWFTEFKSSLSCENCGENRAWVLDFHHVNPDEKEIEIGHLSRLASKKKLLSEMKKCKVLCSNCHRDLHHRKRNAV